MPETDLTSINIGNINDGAILEGFDLELRRVLENIADLNTPATAKRKIVLTLILTPGSDRVTLESEVQCTSKLASVQAHRSHVYVGKSVDGTPVAFSTDPRQLPLWSHPKPQEVKQPLEFHSGS